MSRGAAQLPILPPALRDPVVHGGVKYRIRELSGTHATVRQSFGTKVEWTAELASLTWDNVAGVWRAPRLEVAGQIVAPLDPFTAETVALADATAPARAQAVADPGPTVEGAPPHELTVPTGDLSPSDPAASGGPPSTVDPERCAIHGDALVTAGQAGVRTYAGRDGGPRVYCPDRAGHTDPTDQARCRYCGGRLVPVGLRPWEYRDGARQFCSTTHRNYHWRWIQRGRIRPHG